VIRKRASQGSHQQRQRRLVSDDTEYIFLADLAVALACGQTKTGSRYRGECTAKYDRLLHTERELQLPSPNQIRYATDIARELGVALPADALRYRGAATDFIERFVEAFRTSREQRKRSPYPNFEDV